MSLSAANLFVVSGEEPEMKRARFAQEDAAGKKSSKDTGSSAEAEEDSEEDKDSEEAAAEAKVEDEEKPQHSCWAEDVTTIRMIKGGAGDKSEVGRFSPLFTHQVFYTPGDVLDADENKRTHRELIIGYEEPTLEIVYAANSLKAFIDFRKKTEVETKLLKRDNLSRTSILNCLHKRVPMDYATKLSAVQSEAETPFMPIGTLREEEQLEDGSSLQIFHFIADNPEAVKLVNRMQTFAVWLIETGQAIEVPDPNWNIFTLYRVEKGADNQALHTMLGFYTAHRYWAYDKVN